MTGRARSVRIVGAGRAGGSLARALDRAGWLVHPAVGRGDPIAGAAAGADLVVVAVPDDTVAEVAAGIEAGPAVVAHLAGSLGLDALAPHERRGAVHPLVSMPDAETGAAALVGAWFAVAGDPLVDEVVDALGGRSVVVADRDRARYHAAACIASNHMVALLGHVARVAPDSAPLDAYLDLVRQTLDNVSALGPRAALTGPAARGDEATLARHRAELAGADLAAYDAMVALAQRLASVDR